MRSTRTSLLALLAAFAAAAAGPAAARAADVQALPAAGPAPALALHPAGAELCLQAPSLVSSTSDGHRTTCGDPALRDDAAAVIGTVNAPRASYVVGMVPAAVSSVRVAFPDGSRPVVAAVPVAGLSAGFAGRISAFRVRVPSGPAPAGVDGREQQEASWVQALDGTGRVIGVAQTTSIQGAPRVGPTSVRRLARRAGALVEAVSYSEEVLAPTAADVARTQVRTCLGVIARRSGTDGSGGQLRGPACLTGLAADPTDLPVPIEGCGPPVGGVSGPLPAGTTAAYARLGDGSRVPLRLTSLAPAAPGRVGVAYVAPARQALRAVELEPSGRRLPFEVGPSGLSCAGQDPDGLDGGSISYQASASGVPRTPAALTSPFAPLAGELRGAEGPQGVLCLGLTPAAPTSADCAPLDRAPGAALVVRARPVDGRAVVAGVTCPRAASVRIRVFGTRSSGPTVVVPTQPAAPGVGGAYAGRLRTFTTTLPATEVPYLAQGRDAAGRLLAPGADTYGRILGDLSGLELDDPLGAVSRRIGRIGSLSAWRSTLRLGGDVIRCGAVTSGRRPNAFELGCSEEDGGPQVTVLARCGPTGVVVFAVLRGGERLLATTRAGRTLRARRLPVGGGAALSVLRPGRATGLRSLATTGSRDARRVRVVLPPATAQCGYRTAVSLARPEEPTSRPATPLG